MASQQLSSKQVVNLGSIDFIPLGEGRAYKVGSIAVTVFRPRDGKLYATQSHCPHRQGPLADGIVGAGTVICPFHAWKFDLATGHCAAENVTLRTYPVYELDGQLFIEIE
ncbi:MAG: Rieske (2Fe-2S) protein [Deltaproteobacteria bacterium]|nr:Rieske (2Fe-2S) protein [Deltaproteobacteria bacterium]